ncbi:MAG: threonine dehydratase [Rhodospirillales bacterium]|nr:threonine dehydratase [Rhodospirillales bacterium]
MKPSLEDIEAATKLVYAHTRPTLQIPWPLLARRCGAEVWVKHENHTPIGAFKVRGGLVYLDRLRRERPDVEGVVTATRGNHGQSIAYAAQRFGLAATVVVPHGNNPEKNAAMKAFGAELVEHGRDFDDSCTHAQELASRRGIFMLPSFDVGLVCGVATYGLELLRAVPDLDTVYVPIGLGSGICGMIAVRDALGLATRIVGVVAERAPAYALSFAAGEPVATNAADTLADGVAVRVPDVDALRIIGAGAERVVTVTDEAILAAMAHLFTDTHNLAEGAGAAPLAALLQEKEAMAGKKIGLVLTGGNADKALFKRALEAQ